MPIGEDGFTTTYGEEQKKKRKRDTDPVAVVQHASQGTIPTDVHVALSKLGLDNEYLAKAARVASRTYDVSAQAVWGKKNLKDMRDSIHDGQLRLDTFRLATDGAKPAVIYQMTQGWIDAYNNSLLMSTAETRGPRPGIQAKSTTPKHVAQLLEVIGKYSKGQGLNITQGVSTALQLAAQGVSPKQLEANLKMIDRWAESGVQTSFSQRLGLGMKATNDGAKFNTLEDVNAYLNSDLTSATGERQGLYEQGWTDKTIAEAVKWLQDNKTYMAMHNGESMDIPSYFPGNPFDVAITAPQAALQESLMQYEGTFDGYVNTAEKLKMDLYSQETAFENSWLNKVIVTPAMKLLSVDNRLFEMIGIGAQFGAENSLTTTGAALRTARIIQEAKSGQPYSFTQADSLRNFVEDEKAAWRGELRLSDTLREDYGMNRWVAEGTEFGAGWFLDPLIIAGKGLKMFTMRNVNPLILTKLKGGERTAEALIRNTPEGALRRYGQRVASWAEREAPGLAEAFRSMSDEEIVLWARQFNKPILGQGFDVPWLLKLKDRAIEMGLVKPETTVVEAAAKPEIRLGNVKRVEVPSSTGGVSSWEVSYVERGVPKTQMFTGETGSAASEAFERNLVEKIKRLPPAPKVEPITRTIPATIAPELEQQINDALRLHLLGGVPGDIAVGSLADLGYSARLADSQAARLAAENQPFWQVTKYQGKVATWSQHVQEAEARALSVGKQIGGETVGAFGVADYLPKYAEIPTVARPIPGFGYVQAVGNVFGRDLGDTGIGRQLRKFPTINVGSELKIHEDPMRFFRNSSRRAGMAESEVVSWETRAARAMTTRAPERELLDLLKEWEMGVTKNYAAQLGLSTDEKFLKEEILDPLLERQGANLKSRTFGERNVVKRLDDGTPYIESNTTYGSLSSGENAHPLGSAQNINEIASIDPIIIKQYMDDYVGTMRRFARAGKKVLGRDLAEFQRTTGLGKDFFTVGGLLRRGLKPVGKAVVTLFKFQAVARPAYIFRVVLGDELMRSFATTQSMFEQAMSYGWGSRLADRIAEEPGFFRRVLMKPGEALDARAIGATDILDKEGNLIYRIPRPGARPYESLAATYRDYADLTAESMAAARRREEVMRVTGEWGMKQPYESGHVAAWSHALNRQIRYSPGLAEAARAIGDGAVSSVDELSEHLLQWTKTTAGKSEMSRIGFWSPKGWSQRAANMVWGATMGNPELARLSYLGEVTDEYLQSHFPLRMWMKDGEVLEAGASKTGAQLIYGRPNIDGPMFAKVAGESSWHRFMNGWYKATVGAPENILNRIPYYSVWKGRAENWLASSISPEMLNDPAAKDAIDRISREFALAHNKRIMFDFTENNRVGELMSFVFPFMQPWQENIAVWGHILTRENPALVGYVNRLAQVGLDTGFIKKDENGNYVIPETWWAFASPVLWLIGGRTKGGGLSHNFSLSTQLTSLNMFASSTFPVDGIPLPAPGMSPYAGYALQHFFADRTIPYAVKSYLFQYGPGPQNIAELAKETFVPRYLRTLMTGVPILRDLVGDPDLLTQLENQYIELQQYYGYEPDLKKAHLQAEMTLPYLALMAATAPGAVRVSYPHTWLETLWHDKLDEFNQNYTQALDWWHTNYPQYDLITYPKTATAMVQNYLDENGQPRYADVTGVNPAIPGIRPQATRYAQEILNQPGFKEFANNPDTAMWASVFMIQAANPNADTFDASVYAAQLMTGKIYTRSAADRLKDHQQYAFQQQWDPIEAQYDREFEKLTAQGYDDNDQVWKALVDSKAVELEQIGSKFKLLDSDYLQKREGGPGYQFSFSTDGSFPEGVHPTILRTARLVMNSKVAYNFPAVQGLRAYWDLRENTKDELASQGYTGLESDGAERIHHDYDAAVQQIIAEHPEFETFYNNWFRNDLRAGLPTDGERQIQAWKNAAEGPSNEVSLKYEPHGNVRNQPLSEYARYLGYDSAMDNFSTRAQQARADKLAYETSQVYQERTNYMNRMYAEHPEIVQAYWNKQTAGERAQSLRSLAVRPPSFYSRFDYEQMGIKLTDRAANWIQQIQESNVNISRLVEQSDGYRSSGPLHEEINKFVQAKLNAKHPDKSFVAAVEAMNTWGYGIIAQGYAGTGDKPVGKAEKAWAALLEAINTDRQIMEKNHMHGDDKRVEFDPDNRAWVTNERQGIQGYIKMLKDWDKSGVFAEQYDNLASAYDGQFLEYLIPPIYFKLGDVKPYG